MIIDIILAVALILAVIKGYQQGLIVSIFSVLALIIGIAAAMKLSTVVAGYIGKAIKISDQWLPVISFAVVFIIIVLLVRMAAKLMQKSVQFAMLGWINRLGGMVLFIALYIVIFSILIFYAEQMNFIKPETRNASIAYPYIQPWGPKVIEGFGKILPVFQGMFEDLKDFFGNVSHQLPAAN
jgi:membrane protein required for colicin V production